MSKKILFILEGKNDEPEVINKLIRVCLPNEEYEYAVCEKNIHMLIDELKDKYGKIDENLDILKVLQEKEKDKKKIRILQDAYTDIILIFDLDPQNNITEYDNIRLLLDYFNDSTINGKLYINYPMMQSYRHLKNNESIEQFCKKTVEILDCANYKNTVNNESDYKDVKRFNFNTIVKILKYNISKINYLLNNRLDVMDFGEYIKLDNTSIFDKEKKYIRDGKVSVLNTSIFWIVDYKPRDMLKRIKDY